MTETIAASPNPDVVCLGVHILDVHARPVADIPEGQGGRLVDQIKLSAAGTAAGTAVDLAALGLRVQTLGCVGTDEVGDFVLDLMARRGIDVSAVQRTPDAQTSATVLPIRPNGDRPSFHVVGANTKYRWSDDDRAVVRRARHLHLGGPDSMGRFLAETASTVLAAARDAGVTTSLDLLGGRPSYMADPLRALFPLVDWLTPNEEQLGNLYGLDDPLASARAAIADGVGGVLVSLGADGALVVTATSVDHVPARVIDVVDTTGCGDALSAGFIAGLLAGEAPVDAARLGITVASIVASGLASDAGLSDRAAIDAARTTLDERAPSRTFV